MACYSPLKGFKDNETGGILFKRNAQTTETMEVACGQCFGCRLDRTRMWAMRIIHESELHKDDAGSCFITLTYRSEAESTIEQLNKKHHVPKDYSLNKSHFQKFIKRLRKKFPQKIRYFQCGEYGDETKRPHYHAVLFNCNFEDQRLWTEKEGLLTYTSQILEDLWQYGYCTVSELNWETASYTSGYILKKVNGQMADEEYLRSDENGEAYWVLPPYLTMSLGRKRPGGIGAQFYERYKSDFFPSDTCPVPGKGIYQSIPRYYQALYADESPDGMEKIKQLRQVFYNAHRADFTPQRLHDKYLCARAQYSNHKREL